MAKSAAIGNRCPNVALLTLLCIPTCLAGQTFEQHLEQEVAKLEARHGSGTNQALKQRLKIAAAHQCASVEFDDWKLI